MRGSPSAQLQRRFGSLLVMALSSPMSPCLPASSQDTSRTPALWQEYALPATPVVIFRKTADFALNLPARLWYNGTGDF